MDPWWTEQGAGMAGAIIGSVGGGVLGGIGGGVCGPLAGAGKARGFVLWFFRAAIAIGVALVIAGIVALAMGQPLHVWMVLIGPGVLFAGISGGIYPALVGRYRAHEQRRLAAEELRRG